MASEIQSHYNDLDPPLPDIVLFGLPRKALKCFFYTLINGGLFSFPTNVGHHNPVPTPL